MPLAHIGAILIAASVILMWASKATKRGKLVLLWAGVACLVAVGAIDLCDLGSLILESVSG